MGRWVFVRDGQQKNATLRCNKSEKHWGPTTEWGGKLVGGEKLVGGGKVVGVDPTKFHSNWIKIAKVCFWGGFWVGGVG